MQGGYPPWRSEPSERSTRFVQLVQYALYVIEMKVLRFLENGQHLFCFGRIKTRCIGLSDDLFLSGNVALAFLSMALGHFQVPMEQFANVHSTISPLVGIINILELSGTGGIYIASRVAGVSYPTIFPFH